MSEERGVRVSMEFCFVKIHKSGVFSISSQNNNNRIGEDHVDFNIR